jgi:hypothetical protein
MIPSQTYTLLSKAAGSGQGAVKKIWIVVEEGTSLTANSVVTFFVRM